MPSAISIKEPINQMESMIEAHPGMLRPWIIATITYTRIDRAMNMNANPTVNIALIGRTENEVMPSMAKLNILPRGYLV